MSEAVLDLVTEDSIDPPIIRDLKLMAIDLQNSISRIEKLEESYRGLFHDYNHLEDAIVELRKQAEVTESHISNLHDIINMEDRITASDVLLRLTQLETNVDFEKAKDLIYQGAQTHATILKLQAAIKQLQDNCIAAHPFKLSDRVKDIEYRLGHIIELPSELDIRLQDVERILGKVTDKMGRKPHKCPICDSKGFVNGVENNIAWGHRCATCDGKGIVWG